MHVKPKSSRILRRSCTLIHTDLLLFESRGSTITCKTTQQARAQTAQRSLQWQFSRCENAVGAAAEENSLDGWSFPRSAVEASMHPLQLQRCFEKSQNRTQQLLLQLFCVEIHRYHICWPNNWQCCGWQVFAREAFGSGQLQIQATLWAIKMI